MNALRTIRNHWKKSLFFSACVAYGSKFVVKWQREDETMREFCLKAREYGRQTLSASERPRKVIVFLNPAAKNGKTKYLLDKHILPLLHLAGIEVHVVRTEHEGQAKAYMEVLDNSIVDAILVAGGDGTLSEIVTGLMRRNDGLAQKIPIGVLPFGKTNSFSSIVFPAGELEVERFCRASMAVIENRVAPFDVIEVKPENSGDEKKIFVLSHLRWGTHSDIIMKKDRLWYLGPLKEWVTYTAKALLNWPPLIKAKLEISPPCSGCSKCLLPPPPKKPAKKSWWSPAGNSQPTVTDPRLKVDNPECGVMSTQFIECSQLDLRSTIHDPTKSAMELSTSTAHNKLDFIKLRSRYLADNSQACASVKIVPEGDSPAGWFLMDSEPFESMHVTAKLLKSKINVFVPPDAHM